MRALLVAESGKESGDIPAEQPTFYHEVDYVVRTWLEHRLHHAYPDAGAYNDQCNWLMKDWHTLSMYYIRAEKGVFTALAMPTQADEWESLAGE
jgi:hypothetical protein